MAEHAVRAATSEREQAVVDVLTLAFAQDPMARWALPDAHVYLKAWPLAVRAFGGRALLSGSADVLEDGGAVRRCGYRPASSPMVNAWSA